MAICLLPLLQGCGGNATPDATSNTASGTTSNAASDAKDNTATDTTSNTATDSSTVSITSAEMSRDHDGNDVTTTFKTTDSPVYTQVKLSGPGNGAKVKAAWTIVNAGSDKNVALISKEFVADGAKDSLIFNIALKKGGTWDKGSYKTELYLDGKLAKTLEWEVQ